MIEHSFSSRRSLSVFQVALALVFLGGAATSLPAQGFMADLAKRHDGRSMRASSTFRPGPDGKHDPKADPLGDDTKHSNADNQSVPPGKTQVLLDEQGPGVITHIWITFLGPEPQEWAKNGSANHQEMLLRITGTASKRPGVEAPVGDFFRQLLRQAPRSGQPAGGRGQRHRLQLLLAHAVSQVGPH